MLKLGRVLGLALALSACTTSAPQLDVSSPILPPPEADSSAPGMIPLECESLLQKSQEWGYVPGQVWKPVSSTQALEVAKFFSNFRLVSQAGSDFFHAIRSSGIPAGGESAAAENLAKVQVCDSNLSLTFLEALIAYRWPAEAKAEGARGIYQFILNQQAVVLPFLPRFVSLSVYQKASAKGLIRGGQAQAAKNLQLSMDSKRKGLLGGPEPKNPSELLQRTKQELQFSEEIREKLSRLLPLP